jgi:hypothetical protein
MSDIRAISGNRTPFAGKPLAGGYDPFGSCILSESFIRTYSRKDNVVERVTFRGLPPLYKLRGGHMDALTDCIKWRVFHIIDAMKRHEIRVMDIDVKTGTGPESMLVWSLIKDQLRTYPKWSVEELPSSKRNRPNRLRLRLQD